MDRLTYTLNAELRGDLYLDVLEFAVYECAFALLILRRSLPLNIGGIELLKRLDPYLYDCIESTEWPGTKLLSGSALVHYFRFDPGSADFFKEATTSLYGWVQPDLPEDLCLLRADGSPWLTSISHEKDSYFTISEIEKHRILQAIPNLRNLLGL